LLPPAGGRGQAQANCANLGMAGVPDPVCSQALEGFETAAAAKDLVCE
jgi:hypothetical protein